jgi:hypothetical protein
MNERIRLLAEQAGFYYTDKTGFITPAGCDPAKFAELIVRECMACSTWVGKMNKNAIESVHTAQAINQRIKQQFGVEE